MDYKMEELKRNGEGYKDPTAYKAIKNIDPTARKRYRLMGAIFRICELAGYEVVGRITLKDVNTGEIYK